MRNRFRQDFSELAFRFAESAGFTIQYLKKGASGGYDPETLQPVPVVDTPFDVVAYPTRLSKTEIREPSLVESTDLVILIPGKNLAFEPEEEDSVTVNGEVLAIKRVRKHHYKNEIPLWRLFCSKG